MDDELYTPDDIPDDNEFLASLDALLKDYQEDEPEKEPQKEDAAAEAPPKKRRLRPRWLVPTLCALAACGILAGGIWGVLTLRDPYRRRIVPGVTVGDVDLSGMTRGRAKKALDEAYKIPLSRQEMVVTFQEAGTDLEAAGLHMTAALTIAPSESQACVDSAAAAKAAYEIGRSADTENRCLPLADFLTLDESRLRSLVHDFVESQQNETKAHTAYLEGNTPDLLDPNAVPQVLVITPSQAAPAIEEAALYSTVLEAYRQGAVECTYTGPIGVTCPALADLQELYDANCYPAQEPTIDKETLEVTPGKLGYVFDVEAATEQMIHQGAEDLRIPLSIEQPTISDEDVYFLDVLGHCETPHGTNEKRNTNLRIACAALDGLILQPGEEFSYNDTLGERTADKGYQPAPAYSGTSLVDSLGGGICQVSSTVYLASVYAELTILERVNHGYPVSYIPLGMDATVNWGFTDLKMRNDSPLPVKIHAEESDGYVRVDILGTETRDYDIQMTYSVGGRHVKTFKTKIDKETGQALGPKEQVALSAYLEDIYK